ncbi:MAG TPA: sigma-70 family RNA polymerase sigma factor [Acidisoma sp.]|uniref:sigma-70 family RNA polymerase sigma factor n=1 Tax=Acidisoma sp. TaxID=1872115 RepID=UPI002BA4AC45|nr:sigma-70 family RNA polymerase sigma factor [Acidisoma sp.]HTI02422.1 sigma-70 family RNA polymerase sigma factor [Acidisoma sp.]
MRIDEGAAAIFAPLRADLIGLAYRMTGSRATAEDITQDAFLRWAATDRATIDSPRAWLLKVTARLALDHLKSARSRREIYVGPWLPEPVLESEEAPQEAEHARAETLSFAFLLTLQRLSPAERAIFILHDLFDTPFAEIAALLQRSEAACRQLAVRARAHLAEDRPRSPVPEEERARMTRAFLAASQGGDEAALRAMLAADVVLHTDGGGVRPAARNLIRGAARAARMFAGLARKRMGDPAPLLHFGRINGLPGYVTLEPDGLPQATALEIAEGRITAIYIIRNPEKLGTIAATLGLRLG